MKRQEITIIIQREDDTPPYNIYGEGKNDYPTLRMFFNDLEVYKTVSIASENDLDCPGTPDIMIFIPE